VIVADSQSGNRFLSPHHGNSCFPDLDSLIFGVDNSLGDETPSGSYLASGHDSVSWAAPENVAEACPQFGKHHDILA
jgi:hypothetical protein